MCGIFGHIGNQSSFEKCLSGLKFLEYRGYDSTGIAGIEDGNLICYKEKGKLSELEKMLERKLHSFQSSIGHTRWATHGKPTQINAHPHLDQKKEVAVVHNGIIENYRSLRLMLEKNGVIFKTETDSEVIAQLIAHFYKGDLVKAVRSATDLMKGFWGLAILHKNHPGQIVATRLENPIVVGISSSREEAFISSDPYAMKEKNLDLYFLKNDQIALITKSHVEIIDRDGEAVDAAPEHIDLPTVEISKGSFEHFMLKEIFEQPASIKSSLHNRFLISEGNSEFENFSMTKEQFTELKQIIIIGCGTSWHAGLIAAQQIQEGSGVPTRAEIASEYRYRNERVDGSTLMITLSQSGETFDTVAAMRKAKGQGAQILAICNADKTTLMREAHHTILLRAGPEISVCSTKAFTCQLAVLSLLSLKFARFSNIGKKEGQEFLEQILDLPAIIETVLEQKDQIDLLAQKIAMKPNFFFIGRQFMFPSSLEAALKLKEISYLNACGYPAGELKHGPIALIDSECVVIGLMGNKLTYEKMLSNLLEVKARGGLIIAIAPQDAPEIEHVADHIIYLPQTCDSLSPMAYSVATQLLAYSIACCKGTDIDQPRNLAKSVTVE